MHFTKHKLRAEHIVPTFNGAEVRIPLSLGFNVNFFFHFWHSGNSKSPADIIQSVKVKTNEEGLIIQRNEFDAEPKGSVAFFPFTKN